MPRLSVANGMKWLIKLPELNLHQFEERLIALRIPFMQIRELPRGGQYSLKGTATLIISMFYMNELSEPWSLIPVSSKSVEKCGSYGFFEYLQMDCNGSGHFVGLVTSHSLIKYA